MNLSRKIISKHLVTGSMKKGEETGLKIDQTLTQDATGTMAYLQFEAMGVPKVRTKLSVSYVDHNTLQTGFENADDHRFLQSIAAKYGIWFSPAGNGICHQLHLERFGVPGQTLIGSDSHTPTGGGIGMLAFGAGGLDAACAMAGEPFFITMPKIVKVNLLGRLTPWVSAKDVILELLRMLSVKGGRGKIFEFSGPGVKTLSVPERATITNMGTELGATTSIFPSDEVTKGFLASQGRIKDFAKLAADGADDYDEEIVIDLSSLPPLIAKPHSPDNVSRVSELKNTKVQQVAIGSCTNSSLADMMLIAKILKGRKVNRNVSLVISPGSRQVMTMLAASSALSDMINAGARVLECACGPCIGMGQAPPSGAVSLRTFNRNFEGRSGTKDADVYLCSPEVAVAGALAGEIVDPSKYFGKKPAVAVPKKLAVDKNMFFPPSKTPSKTVVIRGPNIKPLPEFSPLGNNIRAAVVIKLGDNISTDHILPAGAKILPLRSNLPAISEHTFGAVDRNFVKRTKEAGSGAIIAADNYGQGSSREHAALAPRYLGIKTVIAKSFARIHLANLINFGILPLAFKNPADYDALNLSDIINIPDIPGRFSAGATELEATVLDASGDVKKTFPLSYDLTQRQKDILLAGGLLNFIKSGKK
ncbi:MAG: aconitate hydratase [Endomicrobiales bacterium]|nr:aconitate hydratase [Endomicrobiales bacterium]